MQCAGPRQTAVLLMGYPEQRHRPGDADCIEPCRGISPEQGFTGWAEQIVGTAALGCNLAAIERVQRLLLRILIKKKTAASEP